MQKADQNIKKPMSWQSEYPQLFHSFFFHPSFVIRFLFRWIIKILDHRTRFIGCFKANAISNSCLEEKWNYFWLHKSKVLFSSLNPSLIFKIILSLALVIQRSTLCILSELKPQKLTQLGCFLILSIQVRIILFHPHTLSFQV